MDFQEIVKKVSSDFIAEAQQSPQLLEDMAHMEYYMAESYSNRILIELLQNADDAEASEFYVTYKNGNLYVANNGKPFDEHDIIAISRSGASQKERGTTIGYRGIGFKSASALSNEIIIYSSDTAFTFSKRKCAQLLDVKEENVPTVRIPLYIEQLSDDIKANIDLLQGNGYKTIFIFCDADIELLINEVQEIDSGYFLFLRNIQKCEILLNDYNSFYQIQRISGSSETNITIKTQNKEKHWIIYEDKGVSIAFLTDNGIIIPCEKAEAVYHCYLPTLETSFLSCKINADFSTDPSRKNIVLDEKSRQALKQVAGILFSVCKEILRTDDLVRFKNFFTMMSDKETFSKLNRIVDEEFDKLMDNQNWILLNNGTVVSSLEYKMFPQAMDLPQEQLLRYPVSVLSQQSINSKVYKNVDSVDQFLEPYSTSFFELSEIIESMCSIAFVNGINEESYVQLFTQVIREAKIQSLLKPEKGLINGIENILIKTDRNKWIPINEVSMKEEQVNSYLRQEISSRLSDSENMWLSNLIGEDIGDNEETGTLINIQDKTENNRADQTDLEGSKIYKWRSAEEKCVRIEELSGNQAEDVSIKNLGYDVYSVTKNQEKRYIEVKSVKNDFSFSVTNNEYTAAYEYGDEYYICLMYETDNNLIVKYIQNPLKNAAFEKRVRQWDWVCLKYVADEVTYNLS